MNSGDTIVAISSAIGAAARMIVRVSGAAAFEIARKIAPSIGIERGGASVDELVIGEFRVKGWVYAFARPRSYTGEDLVEFHLPGNVVLVRMLVKQIVAGGAREAEAGEFTARAYFNGKMDLTEAEGVAATISAMNEEELSAARRLMSGELARRLKPITDSLSETLALIEAGIDFADEEVTFLEKEQVLARVNDADHQLDRLVKESARFERLSAEPRVVLVGRPNAGKSTLLNALAGESRAIVSPVAGTTRDAIWAHVRLKRGLVRVIDVAGIGDLAEGAIESQMRERAMRAAEESEIVVRVTAVDDTREAIDVGRAVDVEVRSKVDLGQWSGEGVGVSAVKGEGMDRLREVLDEICFSRSGAGTGLALNDRHVHAIGRARAALRQAQSEVGSGAAELVALELRESLDALGSVVGEVSPDDVLGKIFSRFCIGK